LGARSRPGSTPASSCASLPDLAQPLPSLTLSILQPRSFAKDAMGAVRAFKAREAQAHTKRE